MSSNSLRRMLGTACKQFWTYKNDISHRNSEFNSVFLRFSSILRSSEPGAPTTSSSFLLNSPSLTNNKESKQPKVAKAILSGIKQSPKKVNLVASLIRGMRVEDAVAQLSISSKRAAVTVKKVIHAAASNGVNNHGLVKEKLLVAEAFVGKGRFLKRISIHGRGKSGVRMRPRSMLTVMVREMKNEEEKLLRRLQTQHWSKRKRPHPLLPHKLVCVGKPIEPVNSTVEKK